MKEIQTKDWNTFCQKLSEAERGARVDIHWIDRESKREQDIARSAEFQEITFGRRDGCNDQVIIRAGAEGGTETRHEIVEPIHIRLRESGNSGNFNGVAIEAEGGITLLTFHPALHAKALEGLQLEGRS